VSDTKEPAGFSEKLVNAIPRWAWGTLGIFFGVIMTLQITGYNSSLNRVIEAQVKRMERSVGSLEVVSLGLSKIAAQVSDLESRVTALESHSKFIDSKFHKSQTEPSQKAIK
jgi:hypothetical protein